MAVQVQCSACGFRYNAPDSLVGKRVRCKQCSNVFTIAAASAGPLAAQAESSGDLSTGDADSAVDPSDALAAGFADLAGNPPAQPAINLAHAEKSQIKSAFTKLHEGERKIMSFGTEGPEVDVDAVLRGDGLDASDDTRVGAMRRVGSFDYPNSGLVEQYLPWGMFVLCLLFVGMQIFSLDSGGLGWVAPVRLIVLLVVYVGIIFPMAYGGFKGAIRQSGQGMPFNPKTKALASFALPVTLGYVLWIAGESIVALCLGIFLGLFLGIGAIWLLCRIRPENAARPLIRTAAWVLGASAVAIGFLMGVNLTVQAIAAGSGSNDLAVSPIAPHLPWPQPAKPVAKKPSPAKPAPSNPPATQDSTPAHPAGNGGTVAGTGNTSTTPGGSATTPQTKPVDVVTLPPKPTPPTDPVHVTPVPVPPPDEQANGGNSSTNPVPPGPSDPAPNNPGSVNPGPTHPVAQIQWSDDVAGVQSVEGVKDFDQLITPLVQSQSRLLVRKGAEGEDDLELWSSQPTWQRIGQTTLKKDPKIASQYALTPGSGTVLRLASWPTLSVQAWNFKENRIVSTVELSSTYGTPELVGCISDTQAVIFWTNGQMHGIQLITLTPGVGQAQPGWKLNNITVQTLTNNLAVTSDGKSVYLAGISREEAVILHVQLPAGKILETFRIPMLDPQWGVKPSALTISPDGKILATMFENQGNVLLMQWQLPKGTPIGDPLPFVAGTLSPAPANFSGQAIGWIGNQLLLINGRDILDLQTHAVRSLCDQTVLGVIRAEPKTLELIIPSPQAGKGQLAVVQTKPPASQPAP